MSVSDQRLRELRTFPELMTSEVTIALIDECLRARSALADVGESKLRIEPSYPPNVDKFDVVDDTGATLHWRVDAATAQRIVDGKQPRPAAEEGPDYKATVAMLEAVQSQPQAFSPESLREISRRAIALLSPAAEEGPPMAGWFDCRRWLDDVGTRETDPHRKMCYRKVRANAFPVESPAAHTAQVTPCPDCIGMGSAMIWNQALLARLWGTCSSCNGTGRLASTAERE